MFLDREDARVDAHGEPSDHDVLRRGGGAARTDIGATQGTVLTAGSEVHVRAWAAVAFVAVLLEAEV